MSFAIVHYFHVTRAIYGHTMTKPWSPAIHIHRHALTVHLSGKLRTTQVNVRPRNSHIDAVTATR